MTCVAIHEPETLPCVSLGTASVRLSYSSVFARAVARRASPSRRRRTAAPRATVSTRSPLDLAVGVDPDVTDYPGLARRLPTRTLPPGSERPRRQSAAGSCYSRGVRRSTAPGDPPRALGFPVGP
jgi:hypothetical protein